jgi:hypothetical protein
MLGVNQRGRCNAHNQRTRQNGSPYHRSASPSLPDATSP